MSVLKPHGCNNENKSNDSITHIHTTNNERLLEMNEQVRWM